MISRQHIRVIPIHVPPVEVVIQADRQLAFTMLTAFDAVRPSERGSLRVIERHENRWLLDFHTTYALWLGRRSTFVTTEWVTVQPPNRIEFTLARPSGCLVLLDDRFILDEVDGSCRFRYESTFGLRGSVLGWLFGKVVVEPLMRRHMRDHAHDMEQLIEARARTSRSARRTDSHAPPAATPPAS